MINGYHLYRQAIWEKAYRKLESRDPPAWETWTTIAEAIRMSGRSKAWVRARMESGRINFYKDPASHRVYLLLSDVRNQIHLLGKSAGGPNSQPRTPETHHPDPTSEEDLDAQPWSHAIEIERQYKRELAAEESARQAFSDKQREIEEWYQAELRKLEPASPEPESMPDPPPAPATAVPSCAPPVLIDLDAYDDISVVDVPEDPPLVDALEPEDDFDEAEPLPALLDPNDPANVLITAMEAGTLLDLSERNVRKLAEQGQLPRELPPGCKQGFRYRFHDVLALAAKRRETARQSAFPQSVAGKAARERRDFLYRWAMQPISPDDQIIDTREAALLLKVRPGSVVRLVREGRLWGYQNLPGRSGSRLSFRLSHVTALANRPERIKRRKEWEKGRQTPSRKIGGWQEHDIEPQEPGSRSCLTQRDYGEFYTARQVCLVLGSTRNAVQLLRKQGRLQGYVKRLPHAQPEPAAERIRNNWWFFRKTDVDNLLADPLYQAGRKRWNKQIRSLAPTSEELDLQMEECSAIARENERRRQRQHDEWDMC